MRATPRLGVSLRDLLAGGRGCRAAGCIHVHESSGRRRSAPLLLVEKLVKEYPRQGATAVLGKLFSRKPPVEAEHIPRGRWHQLHRRPWRERRPGRRVRLRQVHHVDDGDAAVGPDLRPHRVRRRRDRRHLPNSFARLPLRKSIQMVFQDPTDSLNPRFTAARAIADPIMQLGDIKGRDALRARCEELAGLVGPADQSARPLPASIIRRPEGPRRHRARNRAASQTRDPRRADRGTRRFRAGGGAQFAAGSQGVDGHELFVRVA